MGQIIFWAFVVLVIIAVIKFFSNDKEEGTPMQEHPSYPFNENSYEDGRRMAGIHEGESIDTQTISKEKTKKVAKKKAKSVKKNK